MEKKIKCLMISGKYDCGKTSSFHILVSLLKENGYEEIEVRRHGNRNDNNSNDYVWLLENKSLNQFVIAISQGDAVRYIKAEYKKALNILKSHNIGLDNENLLFVVATRSDGGTIEFYLNIFDFETHLSILKYSSHKHKGNEMTFQDKEKENRDNVLFAEKIFNLIESFDRNKSNEKE